MPAARKASLGDVYNMPPKKVIKAMKGYKAQYVKELEFKKGDFFFVINDSDYFYYEVVNPVARQRGLVPRDHFDSLDKTAFPKSPSLPSLAMSQMEPQYAPRHANHITDSPTSVDQEFDEYGFSYTSNPHMSHTSSAHSSHHSSSSAMFPGMGRVIPYPVACRVQNDDVQPDGRLLYTVELSLSDDTTRVLFRTFDDFYSLHVALLTQYAVQAGRSRAQPRTIPFLPPAPPSRKVGETHAAPPSPAETAKRRKALDLYLADLIVLPAPIRHSAPLNRFFNLRKGDNSIPTPVKADSSATLMDLISDYHSYESLPRGPAARRSFHPALADPNTASVKIKLHVHGADSLAWRVPENITFRPFLEEVKTKVGWMYEGWAIWYKDETGSMIRVHGDVDWKVLVRGRWGTVVLYID
ncbi:uncharacterized protein EV422DRAFT_491397 [Fimicolochytrium jonesii]|uniref:uncharacterized protein n=1 Tax=Fimicolochytrium jonesii TaxID=1396493 RepID=UPI0022FDE9EF|nr:uncharacterized protein EV422DRAFT_491397 [Fimicolochytrium jonesii]KAI8826614.1 hypothetical protein EV422DRAFT_491397 [Fimicolochytrium jonesii]